METKEKVFKGIKPSGFLMIFVILALVGLGIVFFLFPQKAVSICAGIICIVIAIFLCFGFVLIEPNEARVMLFFGKYSGTITDNGFFWVNPFYSKNKIMLRARNLDIEPIKVNDKSGNPIMIGSVLVWRIKDTYRAMFDIDSAANNVMHSCENFVTVQSDAALRQVAGIYAYDNNEKEEGAITLRSSSEEINLMLEDQLNSRLAIAGIEVVEARINYLAYAAEIASVMLRRQQADAIVSAREKIVEGAVGMVQLALEKLDKEHIVQLDEERKAAMVSNLLVVLCADEAAQPVVNTGTLYH